MAARDAFASHEYLLSAFASWLRAGWAEVVVGGVSSVRYDFEFIVSRVSVGSVDLECIL